MVLHAVVPEFMSEQTFSAHPNAAVNGLLSTSAPTFGLASRSPPPDSEHRGQKREAEDPQLSVDDPQPTTRKRTFSNAGPQNGDSNQSGDSQNAAPGSGEKRTATKICRVCGDKSFSYNFNRVARPYFRRNAYKEKELRCPFNGNCEINIVSRRFCQKCRLAKCLAVGMKKEWIMSEEARLEKKKRIQDNRERRAAEKAQEAKAAAAVVNGGIPSSIPNVNMDTSMMPASNPALPPLPPPAPLASSLPTNGVLAPLVASAVNPLPVAAGIPLPAVLPSVQPPSLVPPEPTNSMALHAQQVLAAAASQPLPIVPPPPPPCDPIEQQIAAAQVIAASVQPPAANVSIAAAAAAANLNNAQVVQLAQAAQVVQAMQQQAQLEQQAQIAAQVQQQLAAQVAAQRIQSATAQSTADLVAAAVPSISAQAAAETAVVAAAAHSASAQSSISAAMMQPNMTPPAPVASFPLAPQPLIEPSPPVLPMPAVSLPPAPLVAPPLQQNPAQIQMGSNSSPFLQEMVAVPKAVLTAIVQENIENRQAQQQAQPVHPPLKCVCKCQCGRYPNDLVIVDVVHRDMLNEQQPRAVERMDCQQTDADCCLLSEADKNELNAILHANTFWTAPNESPAAMPNESATDVALRRLIRFASQLNAFRSLSRHDQAALLKNGCASHFTIRSAMTMNENGGWSPQASLSDTVVQFFNSLREEWRTNESVMLLLGLLVIFDPNAPNVENKPLVGHECAKLKSLLKRVLYTLCGQNQQRCCAEFDDLLNKLHVLQSLNNSTIVSPANGLVDSLRWSAEVVEPLLSRELFEPHLLSNSGAVNSVAM
ncbi:Nuclear hormone receptor family member nhr-48 [Aphelenchoides fujianensis]|nr:Nuclear hormone receptor family member nhr-48 [Aphelenchoides fujianensis]